MKACLVSPDGQTTISLKNDITVVGRKQGVCDVFLDRGNVSKIHCLIIKTDGLLLVRDLGSTNGTLVNGQKVSRGALLPGDELSFAGEDRGDASGARAGSWGSDLRGIGFVGQPRRIPVA